MIKQVAVVTGAASGIGAATVERFLKAGFCVLGVDLTAKDETETLAWITGGVENAQTWDMVDAALLKRGWEPTALVTAAAYLMVGTVLDLTDEHWDRTYAVNVRGMIEPVRRLVPGMMARKSGAVVTVGSIDSYMAEQGLISYCTSKGAILQFSRALAMDCARDGVRVNCVCPGVTDTPFFRKHLDTASDPERFLSVREQRNPLGRLLTPDEVAATIVFLASPDASGITGAQIVVDAGLTACFDFRTGAEGG